MVCRVKRCQHLLHHCVSICLILWRALLAVVFSSLCSNPLWLTVASAVTNGSRECDHCIGYLWGSLCVLFVSIWTELQLSVPYAIYCWGTIWTGYKRYIMGGQHCSSKPGKSITVKQWELKVDPLFLLIFHRQMDTSNDIYLTASECILCRERLHNV